MFHKKTLLTLLVAGLILTAGVGLVSAASTNNNEGLRGWRNKFNLTSEQREEMFARRQEVRSAIENNDFASWKKATADKPWADQITKENFSKLVKAHQLRQAGDFEGARKIRQELGLPLRANRRLMHRNFLDVNGDGVCDYLDASAKK